MAKDLAKFSSSPNRENNSSFKESAFLPAWSLNMHGLILPPTKHLEMFQRGTGVEGKRICVKQMHAHVHSAGGSLHATVKRSWGFSLPYPKSRTCLNIQPGEVKNLLFKTQSYSLEMQAILLPYIPRKHLPPKAEYAYTGMARHRSSINLTDLLFLKRISKKIWFILHIVIRVTQGKANYFSSPT